MVLLSQFLLFSGNGVVATPGDGGAVLPRGVRTPGELRPHVHLVSPAAPQPARRRATLWLLVWAERAPLDADSLAAKPLRNAEQKHCKKCPVFCVGSRELWQFTIVLVHCDLPRT